MSSGASRASGSGWRFEVPDLNDKLHSYIEGLADPVTLDEATRAGSRTRSERRRHPALVAALTGASVVLIPVLILGAVRLWPDGDEITALPPSTVTTTTTTIDTSTTLPPVGLVTVPDVVGLSVAEASDALLALGLVADVMDRQVPGTQTGLLPVTTVLEQSPFAGAEVDVGIEVILFVGVAPSCVAEEPGPLGEGQSVVTVLFECNGDSLFPDVSVPVMRHTPTMSNRATEILEALLAGPTDAERAAGFTLFFGQDGAGEGALRGVTISAGRATVDFTDAILINNASTSTGSQYFLTELSANLFQLEDIDVIEYRVEGSCEAFWNWLQGDCTLIRRAEFEYNVMVWDELRPNGSATISPIPASGLDEGVVFSRIGNPDDIVWMSPNRLQTRTIATFELGITPPRQVASDGLGGIVYVSVDQLRWLQAGAAAPIELGPAHDVGRLEVVNMGPDEPRPVLVVRGYNDEFVEALDMTTGEPVESDTVEPDIVHDLSVRLVPAGPPDPNEDEPNFSDVNPTFLVVEDQEGTELTRFRVSNDLEPFVLLHDFDGRRVLLSREPFEPAAGPQTFLLIDLVCGWDCTEFFYVNPASGALTGEMRPAQVEDAVLTGWPDVIRSCSAEGFADDPVAQTGLPDEVAATRNFLTFWAANCGVVYLDIRAAESNTDFVPGHAGLPQDPLAVLEPHQEFIAELHAMVQQPYETRLGTEGQTVYVWPGHAARELDWERLTDAEAAELAAIYGSEFVAETQNAQEYFGWWVEIEEDGRWRFFGVWLS